MRKKLTALLLACLLLVCLVLPVSAADAPALYGTANAADGTVTVTLSLRGGSAVRSGTFTLSYDSSLTLSKTEKGLPLAVANTKEKGKVVCNWVGGAAEADQAVLTLTFTNAATKSYTFKVSGAKVTDKNLQQGSDDDCIYLPYTTAMRLSNQSSAKNFVAIMTDESRANEAKAVVESGLYDLLKSDNAYYIYSASEWLEEMNEMINMVIIILTGIASISLLVGGIGIMNIMLVSVTERTREIGIRKALGAKERTILAQFVVEAATTSALGGVLGIALGYAVSMAANKVLPMFMTDTTVTVSPSFNSIVVAFGISVGIGVLFGYLPARRAARLNPIEALRYD